jgi:hypothetical protein
MGERYSWDKTICEEDAERNRLLRFFIERIELGYDAAEYPSWVEPWK